MRKIIITLIVFSFTSLVFGEPTFTFLKPDKHGKKVEIQVKGKDRTYYRLDKKHPVEVSIEGPTILKVYSRLDMGKYSPSKKVDYKIYVDDNGEKTHYTRSGEISKGIEFSRTGEGKIGWSQTFTIDVSEGKHKIRFYLGQKDDKIVYLRLLHESDSSKKNVERVAMHPQQFTKMVKILVKEGEYDYYRAGEADSLSLKIIGPATLKVLSRLEYSVVMNGGKKYRIVVNEDGKLKNTFLFSTELSEVAIYADNNAELKLSRGDDFYIEVPKGEHTYKFRVQDHGRSALLKFYIPISALDNTID